MCGRARSGSQGLGARKLFRRCRRLRGFKAHVRRRATQDLGGRGECWEAGRKWGLSDQLPVGPRAHVRTCGCSERGGQNAVEAVCAEALWLRGIVWKVTARGEEGTGSFAFLSDGNRAQGSLKARRDGRCPRSRGCQVCTCCGRRRARGQADRPPLSTGAVLCKLH